MDSRTIFVMICLLTTSMCHPWRTSGIPDRRQPPPVASFLNQLLKIYRGADGHVSQGAGLDAGEEPTQWTELKEARNQLNLFKHSLPGHRVPRQLVASPPMRGCHLGTCQIQNLANLLYRYGSNSQKEESHKNNKGTNDPMGYGRRKRRAAGHGVSAPT